MFAPPATVRSPATFTPSEDFLAHACADALAGLGPKPTEAAFVAAMDQVFTVAESTWAARRSGVHYLASAPVPACKAGCGWCCHQQVGITVYEAVRIAAYLRALPPDQGGPLIERTVALAAQTAGMTTAERAKAPVACAFLDAEGHCRIYGVRPLRCRGLYSIDADFCAASCTDPEGMRDKLERGALPPVYLSVPEAIFGSALSGVLMALRRHRAAMISLELSAAVAALLTESRLGRRWLAGAKPDKALALRA